MALRSVEARRQDGSLFHVEVGLSPTTHEGEPVVLAAVVDCTQRDDLETALFNRQEFERALAEISAGFLTTPDDQLDEHITGSQQRLAALLDVERSMLWQAREADDLRYTHLWSSDPTVFTPPPDQLSAETQLSRG